MIPINWVRVKEALHNLADNSGASIEYARGVIVATAAFMLGLGMDWRSIWKQLIPMLPNKLMVYTIPAVWLDSEFSTEWYIEWRNITKFHRLLEAIPEDMWEIRSDGDSTWTCRDKLLDKYLWVLSVFQRERNRAYAEWKLADLPDEPQLVYHLSPIKQHGSQYIAEWSISDMRKPIQNTYNWHGQETSRWIYAGAILVQNGRVSVHT